MNMRTEDILALLNAGYTKEEITALDHPDQPDQPEQKDQPDQPDQKDQPDQPEQKDHPDQSIGESAALTGIMKTLDSMTKAMQAMNLRMSSMEQPKTDHAEDILATIINPTYKRSDET